MALISAGEWIDRYAAEVEQHGASGESDSAAPLVFRIEVEAAQRALRRHGHAAPSPRLGWGRPVRRPLRGGVWQRRSGRRKA